MNTPKDSFMDEIIKLSQSTPRKRRSGLSETTKAIMAGGAAGVLSGVATRPITVIQTRQAMGEGLREAIKNVYRESAYKVPKVITKSNIPKKINPRSLKTIARGLKGFWKGGTTKALGIGAGMAISYPAYNFLMKKFRRSRK